MFVMGTACVLFEVRTEFLNIILTNFDLKELAELSAFARTPCCNVVTEVDFNIAFIVPLELPLDNYLFSFSGPWTSRYTVKQRQMKRTAL
jgi:hypothetical protein